MVVRNLPPTAASSGAGRGDSQPEYEVDARSRQIAALLVMPPSRRAVFRQALDELGVSVCCVEDCRAARKLLEPPNAVAVVVTHVSLPDGNWSDVLRMMADLGTPATVVVDSSEANPTLWSEVFWRGAYDLLVQPCDWHDVCQCLEGALRSWPAIPSRDVLRSEV